MEKYSFLLFLYFGNVEITSIEVFYVKEWCFTV